MSATPDIPSKPPRAGLPRAVKIVLWALMTLVLVAVLAVAGLWWWAGTDGSLATALRYAAKSQPLTATNASGSLRAGGHVDRLQWQQDGLAVDASDVTLAWQPWALLHGTLKLDRIAAGRVQVDDTRTPTTTPSTPPTAVGLPLPVTLDAFSVGALQWNGASSFALGDIAGTYHFTGSQHEIDLTSLQFGIGRYSGKAVLTSVGPLKLDAAIKGALTTAVPGSAAALGLNFNATANGLLTDLNVKADLQLDPQASAADKATNTLRPQASATARVMPWAPQPLPQADATFTDLDVGALWPEAPQTRLTGSASVRPADASVALAQAAWQVQADITNAIPGPWDARKLPLERLQTQAEWRSGAKSDTGTAPGVALIKLFKAHIGGGEINAIGQWASAPVAAVTAPAPTAPAPGVTATTEAPPAQAWQVEAMLTNIDPARLHTQLAPLPINGKATASSAGGTDLATAFDVALQAAGSGRPEAAYRTATTSH